MFINLLKKMNLQLSKACKIEMLKKQNNNSIFSHFISLDDLVCKIMTIIK